MPNPKQIQNNKTAAPVNVFIDESGTLPDPKDRLIVISAVGIRNLKEANNIISRIKSSLRKTKKKEIKEIKFYYAGHNTKRQFLSGIVSANFDIFCLIVDKKGRKIADSPVNYAILLTEIVNEAVAWYKPIPIKVTSDRHFQSLYHQKELNNYLGNSVDKKTSQTIKHVDSQQNKVVNIADMAAGAIHWQYSGKNSQYYRLIKDNIISEKIVSWPSLKQKYMTNKKLTRTDASIHPSEIT
ncbi:MAG: hypothetical protein A3E37_01020 [Candidatus Andersenbacteria bacterium RIFCSPHIGHO2_12_FULL_46_9]|nr:MAG: hypothetical protein UW94_C0020G0004 [Parcubacteria group bacterium GW2011_GWA2_45_14]OGY35941.1 MAG: hypothetical protein A3B76_04165 [Candidatus Andersenbacteria bacterium RIFCSPHIGHO2_02_FULL_46_16]OGY37693.1 MAG: hypothetical protein A3E37_01020 [Candidatus Andersenbacteria bacterium RIFCSPHIGHO2_12_FULL_46_9]OGY38283.1 MAG: hypothetical protein A3I08_03355 [Candidatus Andersenbacteria bacterium RIFCSPLOWO2_02_FULL_46_11]